MIWSLHWNLDMYAMEAYMVSGGARFCRAMYGYLDARSGISNAMKSLGIVHAMHPEVRKVFLEKKEKAISPSTYITSLVLNTQTNDPSECKVTTHCLPHLVHFKKLVIGSSALRICN